MLPTLMLPTPSVKTPLYGFEAGVARVLPMMTTLKLLSTASPIVARSWPGDEAALGVPDPHRSAPQSWRAA